MPLGNAAAGIKWNLKLNLMKQERSYQRLEVIRE